MAKRGGASNEGMGIPEGYRRAARGGPTVRTDIVDVYIFRMAREGDASSVEFLQLLRAAAPLEKTWQPVMGHIEAGESTIDCARRELAEEVGLCAGDPAWLGFWALEQAHPFYVAPIDAIVMSPRLAARVSMEWTPRLNEEHSDMRWAPSEAVDSMFLWPGQKRACAEVLGELVRPGSAAAGALAIPME